MALYSVNANLPGGKKVFTSEAVAPQGSSTFFALAQTVLDSAYMQSSTDGYFLSDVSGNTTTTITFDTPVDVKANEWSSQWFWIALPTSEVRSIVSNTAGDAGASVTVTVLTPFSVAPAGQSCDIRLWEGWYRPLFITSVGDFESAFLDKTAAGKPEWTSAHAAYKTLKNAFDNGAVGIWVVPVEQPETGDEMVSALAPDVDATLTARLLSMSPLPDIVIAPDQTELLLSENGSTLSNANWASIDNAWITYINNRATSESTDEALREMVYITSTKTTSTSAANTYVTSTVNTTNERVFWVHGHYLSPSLTAGQFDIVSPSAAMAGIVNRVSTSAKESFGHAMYGEQFTQLQGSSGVVEEITRANRLSLRGNGINPFITKQGKGTYLEGSFTAAKSSSDSGLDPLEHLHIVLGRAKIWNELQPIMNSMVSQQNTAANRAGLELRIRGFMDNLVSQSIIADYDLTDVTNTAEVNTIRFELKPYFIGAIDYVELKLVAAFAQ